MHANGTAGDEREKTVLANDGSAAMVFDRLGDCGSPNASNAMDHLCGTTLTERVVKFLERYNQSVFGFG
jgi:hypothetical protein